MHQSDRKLNDTDDSWASKSGSESRYLESWKDLILCGYVSLPNSQNDLNSIIDKVFEKSYLYFPGCMENMQDIKSVETLIFN